MNRFIKMISIMVLVALALTESHSVLRAIDKDAAEQKYDLFISNRYERELQVQWYLKMTFDTVMMIVLSFVAAAVSYRVSFKLFMVLSVVCLYHIVDLYAFWYNYKSSVPMYWVLLCVVIVLIIYLIWGKEKQQAIIKSMV